jgi:hypothetical protein
MNAFSCPDPLISIHGIKQKQVRHSTQLHPLFFHCFVLMVVYLSHSFIYIARRLSMPSKSIVMLQGAIALDGPQCI